MAPRCLGGASEMEKKRARSPEQVGRKRACLVETNPNTTPPVSKPKSKTLKGLDQPKTPSNTNKTKVHIISKSSRNKPLAKTPASEGNEDQTNDSEETEDSQETDYVSDSEAINPKQPFTFKKTRQVHDTDFKLKVIQWHIECKLTQLETSRKFDITQSTLSRLIQQHHRLNESLLKNRGGVKRLRPAKFPELEQALFAWAMEAHAHSIAVNDAVLKEKAIQLGPLTHANMNFSDGWLHNFKKRFNIWSRVLHGEAASVDPISAEKAREDLQEVTKGYSLRDIYNADETGLTYK